MEISQLARLFAPAQDVEVGRARPTRGDHQAASHRAGEDRAGRGAGANRSSDPENGVFVSLSPRAAAIAGRAEESTGASEGPATTRREGADDSAGGPAQELSREEQEEVRRLRARDAEVRAHEQAHQAAAGRHARGGPKYETERGPDGRQYATGGEVSIDSSPIVGDPDATIQKMQQVRRAALAPANPSPQDRKVASEASRSEAAARSEKLEEGREERGSGRAGSLLDVYASPRSDKRGGHLDLSA